MSLDNEAVRLAYLGKANRRATEHTLNVPLSRALEGTRYGRGKGIQMDIDELEGGAYASSSGCGIERKVGAGRGRPRKQTQKDREDERLAAEIEELKGGSMDLKFGGSKAEMKKMAKLLGEHYGKGMKEMDKEVGELVGSGFWSDFAGGLKKGLSIGKEIARFVPIPAVQAAVAAGDVLGLGKGEKKMLGRTQRMFGRTQMKEEEVKGGRRAPASAGDKRKKRGALISKLMRQNNMTLGEASKHIKEHNLM